MAKTEIKRFKALKPYECITGYKIEKGELHYRVRQWNNSNKSYDTKRLAYLAYRIYSQLKKRGLIETIEQFDVVKAENAMIVASDLNDDNWYNGPSNELLVNLYTGKTDYWKELKKEVGYRANEISKVSANFNNPIATPIQIPSNASASIEGNKIFKQSGLVPGAEIIITPNKKRSLWQRFKDFLNKEI